ncbi:ubiquitin-specific protease ubp15 [Tieghemiomyces parasiticus]|uniref:ubiquitinyl hydrolase 1 n=1 Tax=Tieghemiomyces parasiticus TaxID=78921 RepID=A0A9W7ZS98_9FUNG|nr:ubiquitin-specific protease ubp15 [Tieghemiomyces parasiticus]
MTNHTVPIYDGCEQGSEVSQDTPQPSLPAATDPSTPADLTVEEGFLPLLEPLEYPVVSSGFGRWDVTGFSRLPRRAVGPVFEAAGHKWRFLIFPQGNEEPHHLALYLELMKESFPPEGYLCAHFHVALTNPHDQTVHLTNVSQHRFIPVEADWGFNRFADHRYLTAAGFRTRPLMENDAFTVTAYIRTVRDEVGALWHSFTEYDSRKESGYVGMVNQGATCYMNSLLQSLYFTNELRRAVYRIPTPDAKDTRNVTLALQRVFYKLQYSDTAVDTTELTRSFGWDSLESFMQHDVQEFNRVLQDNLEGKMKGTPVEGTISRLFVGRMKSYIKCVDVDFESSRTEAYYDIQLNVKGCRTLYDSFKDYIAEELLEGDNKYMAEGFGLQDAKKGVIFEAFPPVLHLQLKRFEYDMIHDTMVKINDRHEFPDEIDLVDFLAPGPDRPDSCVYALHGVLVHSGDVSGGHYFALLRPEPNGRWFRFDDDRVVPVRDKDVFEAYYGGEERSQRPGARSTRPALSRYTNAYMLVYIRRDAVDQVLAPVTETDIPQYLRDRFDREKREAEEYQKQLELERTTIKLQLVTDEAIRDHQGFDLLEFDCPEPDAVPLRTMRVPKTLPAAEVASAVAAELGREPGSLRLWQFVGRQNKTNRPDVILGSQIPGQTVEQVQNPRPVKSRPLRLYVETVDPNEPVPDRASQRIILFLKFYDHVARRMTVLGSYSTRGDVTVASAEPALRERAGLPADAELLTYEEVKPGRVDPFEPTDSPVTFFGAEMQSGDILCFQRRPTPDELATNELATVRKYFDYYASHVQVKFLPVTSSDESGDGETTAVIPPKPVWLRLPKQLPYDGVVARLADRLDCDPRKLRLYNIGGGAEPLRVVKRSPHMTLAEMARLWDGVIPPSGLRLHFEILSRTVDELDQCRLLSVAWLAGGVRQEVPFTVLLPKTARVAELETALRAKVAEHFRRPATTGPLRVYTAVDHRIDGVLNASDPLKVISDRALVYAEELPAEELQMTDRDAVVPVFHYYRRSHSTQGIPFFVLVKAGEPVAETKARLQRRLGYGDKEFSKLTPIVFLDSAGPYRFGPLPVSLPAFTSAGENGDADTVGAAAAMEPTDTTIPAVADDVPAPDTTAMDTQEPWPTAGDETAMEMTAGDEPPLTYDPTLPPYEPSVPAGHSTVPPLSAHTADDGDDDDLYDLERQIDDIDGSLSDILTAAGPGHVVIGLDGPDLSQRQSRYSERSIRIFN